MGKLSPFEIVNETEKMALFKVGLPVHKTVILAMLAGVYISIGGALSVLTGAGFGAAANGNPIIAKMVAGATFPLGLILIVFAGAELFTGNTAVLIPAWLNKKYTLRHVLANWLWVYLGNLLGVLVFTYFLLYLTNTLDVSPYKESIIQIAQYKAHLPWGIAFLKAVGANWLVCLAVWLGISSHSTVGKMIGLWAPIFCFVILGYEHSIANMFYFTIGLLEGADVTVWQAIWNNVIPVTLGNIIGGSIFVGGLYWMIYSKNEFK